MAMVDLEGLYRLVRGDMSAVFVKKQTNKSGIWNTSTLDSLGHGSDRVHASVASGARGLTGRTTRGYRERETDPSSKAG